MLGKVQLDNFIMSTAFVVFSKSAINIYQRFLDAVINTFYPVSPTRLCSNDSNCNWLNEDYVLYDKLLYCSKRMVLLPQTRRLCFCLDLSVRLFVCEQELKNLWTDFDKIFRICPTR